VVKDESARSQSGNRSAGASTTDYRKGMTIMKLTRKSDSAVYKSVDSASTPEGKPTITIYVRKGDESWERTISINPIPAEADPLELLDAGFAIDGNSATLSVYRAEEFVTWADPENGIASIKSEDPGSFEYSPSLNGALRVVERTIVAWLKKLGYTPKFG